MARTIGIGIQSFEKIREEACFYVDKTGFIREWWENKDDVTLIARPRRFGKTLNMSMLECFFSTSFASRSDLFAGLSIWQEEKYRRLQGTYPVINLSFANVKETSYAMARKKICQLLVNLYSKYVFLLSADTMTEQDKDFFKRVTISMDDSEATLALHQLSSFLCRYYGKKVILLLDEYDTPMQEAYIQGYWDELAAFTRSLFNAAFKTNPYLERALMTGITRISKESIFSDLNNLTVITATTKKYDTAFGFTEEEVFSALKEYGLPGQKQTVKKWYDGFAFGERRDIYNPWSILNFLDRRKEAAYWANTSGNSLVGKLIREGSRGIKTGMEELLAGKAFHTQFDEEIVFSQLDGRESAVWSLLLASGYLRVEHAGLNRRGKMEYDLKLTNWETRLMFEQMVEDWFAPSGSSYNDFVRALLEDDRTAMNRYMNRVALATFSAFDTGGRPSGKSEPERFYHGFVLGLIVELADRYTVSSNRESGFGRYDVILEPCDRGRDDTMILEFKVFDPSTERTLSDTVLRALAQIEKKRYAAGLEAKGYAAGRIRRYGFAFKGKEVLIG